MYFSKLKRLVISKNNNENNLIKNINKSITKIKRKEKKSKNILINQ
jgi:hypothetical protein